MKRTLRLAFAVLFCIVALIFMLCSCSDDPTIEINSDGYWVINGVITNVKAEGDDGTTPTISINADGYWVINGVVTEVKAAGDNGVAPTISINENGYWVINGVVTELKAVGTDGATPTIDINEDGYWVINGVVTEMNAVGADGTTPTVEINEDGYWVINGVVTDVIAQHVNKFEMFTFDAYQQSEKPIITVDYRFNGFDFDSYSNVKLSLYYKNRLLAVRDLGTADSSIVQEVCYGRVTARFTADDKDGNTVVISEKNIPVYSDEYNIVSMNGSMPVLYFTLHSLSKDGDTYDNYQAANLPTMADAPTIIALERVNSYDWDMLPSNTYWLPSQENPTGDFHANNVIMAEYIRELYEINPDTKFNFYCVDNYPELILKFFVAQGISNYHATMVSDGTSTVACFKKMTYPEAAYGESADEVYSKMAAEWMAMKTAAGNGSTTYLNDVFMGNPTGYQILENYAFVIATLEDNVDWWCARKSLLTDNANSDYIRDLLEGTNNSGKNANLEATNVIYPSLGTMLAKLSTVDSLMLKNLYKFNDQVFNTAGDKEILMVLGTSTSGEGDLEAYLTYLSAEYGDTHQIYYKGHPGWPTALNPEKQAMLNRLGIIDVESYIAAEIILFYCPDIYLAGYQSSTFYSAQDDRIMTLFMTEANQVSAALTYEGDTYISPVSAHGDTYSQYQGCFVIEYANSTRVDVFNPTTGVITNIVE